MSDPKQVQQRLMRLVREVDGLTWADRKCIGEAISLIDEVRGVDAEPVPAIQRFNELMEDGYESPLERLRFFCSLAMNGQDWLDVEPFLDALYTHPAPSQPAVQRWKLVPEEPTAKMCAAADEQKSYDVERGTVTLGSNIYRAMLDAAPTHEPAAPVGFGRTYGGCPHCGSSKCVAMQCCMPDGKPGAAPVELPVVGDAERLEFMANSPARYIEKYDRMWRVYQDQALPTMASAHWVAMTTQYWGTPREAIDAAIASIAGGK